MSDRSTETTSMSDKQKYESGPSADHGQKFKIEKVVRQIESIKFGDEKRGIPQSAQNHQSCPKKYRKWGKNPQNLPPTPLFLRVVA